MKYVTRSAAGWFFLYPPFFKTFYFNFFKTPFKDQAGQPGDGHHHPAEAGLAAAEGAAQGGGDHGS